MPRQEPPGAFRHIHRSADLIKTRFRLQFRRLSVCHAERKREVRTTQIEAGDSRKIGEFPRQVRQARKGHPTADLKQI
jgi:hypothetical protein